MIRIVISQPMFLPWRGMFEQLKLSDVFVFYDDVQIPKGGGKGRGFITRVQIKTKSGWKWLSVPVDRSGKGYQLIKDVCFQNADWRNRHLTAIKCAYADTPFFNEIYESLVVPIYEYKTKFLNEFSINAIKKLSSYLGTIPKFYISSDLNISLKEDPSQRVLGICRRFKADEYITGHGARNYLNYEIFEKNNISVKYMEYKCTPYPQLYGEFNPYVTILDLLFNVGPESCNLLDSDAVYWKEWKGVS